MQAPQTLIRRYEDGYELDLIELIQILLRGIHIIILTTLAAGLITFLIVRFLVTPLYIVPSRAYIHV